MIYIRKILVILGLAAFLGGANVQAASVEEHQEFAAKMKRLHVSRDFDYARAVMLKYLELEPDAAAIKRELAHNYMKTSAQPVDTLIEYRYPDDRATQIIRLLDEAIAANPEDHESLALLVYTHALQGNVEQGTEALIHANSLEQKGAWLDYNAALLAISDQRYFDAVDLLTPIGVHKNLPDSPDANRIYETAWHTLNKLALTDPKLDTLATVREGLATRVDIHKLPEYMLEYDPNGPPVLLHFSSQDKHCGYCTRELPKFHDFALRNKEHGNKYHVVYLSSEPWRKLLRDRADILVSMSLAGVPSYFLAHDGAYTAQWAGTSPEIFARMLDDPESMLSNSNMFVKIEPRSVYYRDYMLSLYYAYRQEKKEGFKSMAVAIGDKFWAQSRKYGFQTQASADEAALKACQKSVNDKNEKFTCSTFARGDTLIDSAAVQLRKLRASNKKKVARKAKKTSKQRNKPKKDKKPVATPLNRSNNKSKNDTAKAVNDNAKLVESKDTKIKSARSTAEAIRHFAGLEEHYKALAIAQAGEAFVTGFVSKEITQYRANKKALDNCNTALQETVIGADCLLHTIGKSEVTDQSEKSIQKLTARQQKRNAKNSALAASYKKYRKYSTDKAYAISVNDNEQWAYGMAFGKRGEDKATAAALTECETKRVAKNLDNECYVLLLNSKFVEQTK